MLVSIEYVEEDPTQTLAEHGVTVRDWDEDMQICIADVLTKQHENALDKLAADRDWFVNWRYERYHEYTMQTFTGILQKVLDETSTK